MGRRGQGQGHRPARQPGRRRRQVQRRQQCGPHNRGRVREVCVAPSAVRHPDAGLHADHRQRGRRRPRRAVRGDRRAQRPGRRYVAARGQRRCARHHAVQPHARQGDRALPGQSQTRHDRARHRPDVRRQDGARRHPRTGSLRRGRAAREGHRRAELQEPGSGQGLQPSRLRRRCGRGRAARIRRPAAPDGG